MNDASDLTQLTQPAAPTQSSQAVPADPGAGQDPLAALEELLKQSSKGGGAVSKGSGSAGGEAPEKNGRNQPSAEEQAAAQKQFEQINDAQTQIDQQKIKEEIEQLKTITQTPQYQARMAQDQSNKQAVDEKQQQADDYQIRQLGHTKI